jgi:hypothetical protein
MKTPSIKPQAPEKLQTPIPNVVASKRWTCWELGIWDLFEVWSLGFGAF